MNSGLDDTISTSRGRVAKKCIFVIAILNITDAIFTWVLLKNDWAFEINPLANFLISGGPILFFTVKIGLGSGALIYLAYRLTREKAAKYFWPIMIILMMYGTINFLHFLACALGPYIG